MVDMNLKLDNWKRKLLDLGKRNAMLNYRDTKSSNLRIVAPDVFQLWQKFVINEEPLIFPVVESKQSNTVPTTGSEEISDDYLVYGLKTNKAFQDLQKTLRTLRNRSKTFIEEQGINALYLTFGFLSWSEADHSEQFFDAPLILVPVTITWESITSPYIITRHDDEIVVNPTLSYKLENEFGIKLPSFEEDGSLDLFFSKVEKLVSAKDWTVKREAAISMLSYLKINIYNDLEKHREEINTNPIVRAIAGDATAISHDVSGADGYDHDTVDPKSIFQILDADSSQQDAILCAKKGISFVLQGPPGTGKSQTITNIISESLADGKKVLFVAEKMAALDVVYRRLSDANLADFCLILHSHKANKKDTLAQLGNVLRLASKQASIRDDIIQQLRRLTDDRKALNDYARQVNEKIQPLGRSIFEVNGELAELTGVQDVIFGLPNIKSTDREKLNDYYIFIRKYASLLKQMNDDIESNPWKDSSIDYVTNELRHDYGSKATNLLKNIKSIVAISDRINEDVHIPHDPKLVELSRIVDLLGIASASPVVPETWIQDNNAEALIKDIPGYSRTQSDILAMQQTLKDKSAKIGELDSNRTYVFDPEIKRAPDVDYYLQTVDSEFLADECYKTWSELNDQVYLRRLLDNMAEAFEEKAAINKSIADEYEKDIFDIDYNTIYIEFKAESAGALKIFNSKYREHKKLFTGLRLGTVQKPSDDEILKVLQDLRKLEEINASIEKNRPSLQALFHSYYHDEETDFDAVKKHLEAYNLITEYRTQLERYLTAVIEYDNNNLALKTTVGDRYKGLSTDWDDVLNAANWAKVFKDYLGEDRSRYAQFITETCNGSNKPELLKNLADLKAGLSDIQDDYKWFQGLFEHGSEFDNTSLVALYDKISACSNSFASLEEWIDLRSVQKQGNELGLGGFIRQTREDHIKSDDLLTVFKKRFFRLWLDQVLPDHPAVANFRGKTQEQIINEFREIDRSQFNIASARVRARLIGSLPSVNHFTSGIDEISVLRRELGKQRKLMPTRKLFSAIPNLIMNLKPCLLMSPLSVSLFLESDCFNFDTVIFDEASQVCTENAIGAILRGKQVIIAGDSHQLPPTSFFRATLDDNDYDSEDDEPDDTNAFESVLDEAAFLPERTLLWHYRSRHEHLIAFSNAKIYHNELITFPSNVDRVPNLGVEYVYVPEGSYDRGGRRGNAKEAEKVADMVFEHFRNFPDRSLGVIAFGEAQQNAIDTVIRKRRLDDQQYEEFFSEDRQEPFFVKSIENVQGDERDTIIFSIGYAKDPQGKMYMNFGPLSVSGGERRLNVAITRAKYNVKLVGSIMPTDIDLDRVSSEGTKLLRSYIEYAIHGPEVLERDIMENEELHFDSPFEESVFNFLDRKGYKIATQVGCSDYRIDLAIKHPSLQGRYVLGIECDGASYHSARTARERDRLRQDVLESMGWKIYRIWSTDWIKDPVTEGEKLVNAVEEALNSYVDIDYQKLHTVKEEPKEESIIIEEEKQEDAEDINNPYGFAEFVPAELSYSTYRKRYLVIDAAVDVIYKEYPVHFDRICQLLSGLFGREKASSVVKESVKNALRAFPGEYKKKGDFYYPPKYSWIPVRKAGIRPIQYISPEELATGMFRVLQKCIGANKEDLITETVRAFGFNRRGVNILDAMNTAYNMLLRNGIIKEFEGKVFIFNQAPAAASDPVKKAPQAAVDNKLKAESSEPEIIFGKPELLIPGARAYHKIFGYGYVQNLKDDYVLVAFDDGRDRKLEHPRTAEKGILGYVKVSPKPIENKVVYASDPVTLERKCENCAEYVRGDCGGVLNAKTCADYKQKVR